MTYRARREAVLRQATEGADASGEYKGMNNYVDYHKGFRREHTIGSEKGSGMAVFWVRLATPRLSLQPSRGPASTKSCSALRSCACC